MAFQSHWSTLPEDRASDEVASLNTTFVYAHFWGKKKKKCPSYHIQKLDSAGGTGSQEEHRTGTD